MAAPDQRAPDAPDSQPGYPEPQPRSPGEAQQPHRRKPNPDEGGLDRKPDAGQDPADDD